MGPEFYQTRMGQEVFEGRLPALIAAVNRLAEAVEENTKIQKEVIASMAKADRCE